MQLIRRAPRGPWQRTYSHARRGTRPPAYIHTAHTSDGTFPDGPPSFLALRGDAWRALENTLGEHGLTGSSTRQQWAWTATSFIGLRSAVSGTEDTSAPTPHRQDRSGAATDKFVGELASLLIGARHFCRFDLLSYLGISQGRWDAVSWIIKALSERPIQRPLEDVLLENGPLGMRSAALKPSDDLATRISFDLPVQTSGDALHEQGSWALRERGVAQELQMAGLGQVWRSLGNFVLLASSSKDTEVSQHIMDQTLGAFAILHHNGIMPQNTYVFASAAPTYPFIIDRLSHIIMMAVLDAEWNLNQSDSPGAAKYQSQAQFAIPGVQFSDLHNPERILPYAHSIWLELILWSCLKGRWVTDGMDILHRVIQQHHGQKWSIVSDQLDSSRLIHVPETSLSKELMMAYSRAILNTLPSQAERFDSSTVMGYLHELKAFLGYQNVSFDKTMQGIPTRVIAMEDGSSQSSAGSAVLDALRLLSDMPDGRSGARSNTLLGLHHQLLRSSLAVGSCDMVIRTVKEMRVVLKTRPSEQPVPTTTLANLLDFISYVDPHVYGREILFGRGETDTPLIPDNLESAPEVLPSLLRYATKTGDVELSKKIALAFSNSRSETDTKAQMMLAVAESQIEHRQWDNLEQLLTKRMPLARDVEWSQGLCTVIASLAKACLLLQRECLDGAAASEASLERAATLLRLAVLVSAPRLTPSRLLQVHTLLGMLASVGAGWAALCRPLLRLQGRQPVKTTAREFALLLEGVAGALPPREVRAFWERWCQPAPEPRAGSDPLGRGERELLVRGVAPAPAERAVDVRLPGEEGGEVLTYIGGVAPDWRAMLALYRCVETRQESDDEDKRFLFGLVKGFYGGGAAMLREVGHIVRAKGSRGDDSSDGITEDVDGQESGA